MKKILLAVFSLFAIGASSYAQEANAGDFNIGITVGGGLTKINTENPYEDISLDEFSYKNKFIANIKGGLVFDYAFVDNFFVEGGLTFQRKGGKVVNEMLGMKTTVTTNLYYIEVPITLNYRINIGDFGLIPQVGPYVAFGVGGKTKTKIDGDLGDMMNGMFNMLGDAMNSMTGDYGDLDYDSGDFDFETTGTNEEPEDLKSFGDGAADRLDFGLRMGVGLAFSEKVKLTLGYDLGLLDIYRTANKDAEDAAKAAGNTEYEGNAKSKNGTIFGTLTFYIK